MEPVNTSLTNTTTEDQPNTQQGLQRNKLSGLIQTVEEPEDSRKEQSVKLPKTPKENTVHFLKRFLHHYSVCEYHSLKATSPPFVDGYFNGKKDDLVTCLANVTADKKLRSYGLLHLLPFYLNQLTELFDDEEFQLVTEVHIDHYATHLIGIHNRNPTALELKDEVIVLDIGEVCEYFRQETMNSRVNKMKMLRMQLRRRVKCDNDRYHHWMVLGAIGVVTAILAYSNSVNRSS